MRDCCTPFTFDELPYQQCGIAADGCGGQVDFGDCDKLLGAGVPMDSPFYPIIWRLRELLAATEAMLHGGGEGREAACHAFYCASLHSLVHVVGVSQTEDADFWALEQVKKELTWLCGRRTPENAAGFPLEEVQQHLDGLKRVYDMYLQRIACMPGDFPCSEHGNVTGTLGDCRCDCHDGFGGADCTVAAALAADPKPVSVSSAANATAGASNTTGAANRSGAANDSVAEAISSAAKNVTSAGKLGRVMDRLKQMLHR